MEDVAVVIFRIVFIAIVVAGFVKRSRQTRTTGRGKDSAGRPTTPPFESHQRPDETASGPTAATPARPASATSVRPAPATTARPANARNAGRVAPAAANPSANPSVNPSSAGPYVKPSARPSVQPQMMAQAVPQRTAQPIVPYPQSHPQPQPAVPRTAQLTAEQSVAPAVETDDRADIIDNFNLRDAVLYSEILRPKFDEF